MSSSRKNKCDHEEAPEELCRFRSLKSRVAGRNTNTQRNTPDCQEKRNIRENQIEQEKTFKKIKKQKSTHRK